MVLSPIWRRRLIFFGSATILAIREIIVRTINGRGVGRASDRIRDYAVDIITMLAISTVMIIGIITIWMEIAFAVVWFLLFLLEKLL